MSTRKNKKERTIIQVDTLIERIEKFYETYKKQINIISTVALVIIATIVLFFVWYMPKQQLKAEGGYFTKPSNIFAADSLTLALNGDGMYEGLLDVIDNYGLTKTAKRARVLCRISLSGKSAIFDNAIRYLKKVRSKDKFISFNP